MLKTDLNCGSGSSPRQGKDTSAGQQPCSFNRDGNHFVIPPAGVKTWQHIKHWEEFLDVSRLSSGCSGYVKQMDWKNSKTKQKQPILFLNVLFFENPCRGEVLVGT